MDIESQGLRMRVCHDNGHTHADSKLDALTKATAVLTEVSRPISTACVAASPVTALPMLWVCQDLSE
ncbi:hypothetical protein CJ179_41750 [Rhodococcus sp. ACS1]|nr:hypothetical protein CJ179_41750 [Rhodococcus sp. ACS1]